MAGGNVSIQLHRDKLRLVWSWSGKRYFIYTGLKDTSVNRLVCESKARIIEADCATGNFDPTLKRYKGESASGDRTPTYELFQRFIKYKERHVYQRTLEKYLGLKNMLQEFFKERPAVSISDRDADKFKNWLSMRLAPVTVKERIGLLLACWNWAEAQNLIESNPWKEVRVRVPPKPKPKPFTQEEVEKILSAFAKSDAYKHYLPYVKMLLGTGLRIGEAIGLRWEHVSDDCSQLWIGESHSRGRRKETKTNQARTIVLPEQLQAMLISLRKHSDTELVFPAPRGGPIDDHNFRNRAWKTCLQNAGVEYRKPYITRSTFISHALAHGMNPAAVADLIGDEVETLFREYAGSIESTPKIPAMNWLKDKD